MPAPKIIEYDRGETQDHGVIVFKIGSQYLVVASAIGDDGPIMNWKAATILEGKEDGRDKGMGVPSVC